MSINVFCEWKKIHSFFPDSQLIVRCLHLLRPNFIARIRRNSFASTATAFVLTPLGLASICAAEQGFQTQGDVDGMSPGNNHDFYAQRV
jgi:hypothetical protein